MDQTLKQIKLENDRIARELALIAKKVKELEDLAFRWEVANRNR